MIKYKLVCDSTHDFEAWFSSGENYDRQHAAGLVECPFCGSQKVEKALMTPRIQSARKSLQKLQPKEIPSSPTSSEVLDTLRDVKKDVETHFENVGDKFPEEARKMHYGDAEPRGIHGTATVQEASSLAEEGVKVVPLIDLPEDKN